MTRRQLTLALALTPGIGGKTVTRVLVRNDLHGRSVKEFFGLGPEVLQEEYRMGPRAAGAWAEQRGQRWDEAGRLLERLDRHGAHAVTAADEGYPHHLEQLMTDPPGVLYLYGNARLLNTMSFCVLSSRKASEAQLKLLERLTEDGVLAGETLVSGHDTPEYQRSAVVPLRWGAPRILVLDVGLFQGMGPDLSEEPFRAARLWRYQFDPKTDLAISTINPDRPFHPNSNRVRDQVIGGLSHRLDFVHVAGGGTMERVALAGLRAGRTVRVAETVEGYDRFTAQGARLVLNA